MERDRSAQAESFRLPLASSFHPPHCPTACGEAAPPLLENQAVIVGFKNHLAAIATGHDTCPAIAGGEGGWQTAPGYDASLESAKLGIVPRSWSNAKTPIAKIKKTPTSADRRMSFFISCT
jgi:hypothetical protein